MRKKYIILFQLSVGRQYVGYINKFKQLNTFLSSQLSKTIYKFIIWDNHINVS
ncbi:hypothetical protein pb186bvf_021174 [Paramecium bursaria]